MKPPKNYMDWEKVLLDTNVIIDYLNAVKGKKPQKGKDKYVQFIKFLIDDLTSHPNNKSKSRMIVVSSISISEILTIQNDEDFKKKILTAFNTSTVQIVSWSKSLAIYSNKICQEFLSEKQLNALAEVGFPDEKNLNKKLAREYLIKDYMIASTALYAGCDVVITSDKKTFIPIADKLECPSIIPIEENFTLNGSKSQIFSLK